MLRRAEWRKSGSKVIQSDINALVPQLPKSSLGGGSISQHGRLGNLELEAVRVEVRNCECVANSAYQAACVTEMHSRDVDRQADMIGPKSGCLARLLNYPFAQRHNEAALLSERQKVTR